MRLFHLQILILIESLESTSETVDGVEATSTATRERRVTFRLFSVKENSYSSKP